MSEEKHYGLSETHKNIAIEIQNMLAGTSLDTAIDVLNSVKHSIMVDLKVPKFGTEE